MGLKVNQGRWVVGSREHNTWWLKRLSRINWNFALNMPFGIHAKLFSLSSSPLGIYQYVQLKNELPATFNELPTTFKHASSSLARRARSTQTTSRIRDEPLFLF